MPTVDKIVRLLDALAPPMLAEEWDNVGLLVGDRQRPVRRLMTCLTLTPTTVAEAIQRQADLVVVHHPLPFRPLSRVTTDTTTGRLLWDLIGAHVAVYSPHTAFDSARGGINELLAAGLGLQRIEPLTGSQSQPEDSAVGAGRYGAPDKPLTLADLAERVKAFLSVDALRLVGDANQPVQCAAVACGSGGSFLPAARENGCDCLVTGEANFHTCLEAEATGVGLILAGHFASERFALERLADTLDEQLSDVQIWASELERDPLQAI